MYRIRTHNKISEKGTAKFPKNLYALSTGESNPQAIVLRSYKLRKEEFGNELSAIGRAGTGVNNIPVSDCTQSGIVVFNAPGANANAVKELVLTGLFLSSRKINKSFLI